MRDSRLSRRGVVQMAGIGAAAAGLLGVAGCSSGDGTGTASPSAGTSPNTTSSGAPNAVGRPPLLGLKRG